MTLIREIEFHRNVTINVSVRGEARHSNFHERAMSKYTIYEQFNWCLLNFGIFQGTTKSGLL